MLLRSWLQRKLNLTLLNKKKRGNCEDRGTAQGGNYEDRIRSDTRKLEKEQIDASEEATARLKVYQVARK